MQDHHALSTVYNTKTDIVGRTEHAALPTAQDVLGNKTAAIAASSLTSLPAMAKTASQKVGGAISAAAFEKRFRVQHDLVFNKNATIAELYPTNEGSYIIPQLWTTAPFSWGSIHLGAAGNIEEPVIDSGLLQFEIDSQLLEGVFRLSRNVYTSAPLTDLVGAEISPGEAVLALDATTEQYAAYIEENGKCMTKNEGFQLPLLPINLPFFTKQTRLTFHSGSYCTCFWHLCHAAIGARWSSGFTCQGPRNNESSRCRRLYYPRAVDWSSHCAYICRGRKGCSAH